MEYRALRETEVDEMIALQCLVFRPDGQERFAQYLRGDASYDWEQTRVGVQDGRIVSTLRVWERILRVGSCQVRMGGIGGVGTHPDFRGAGHGSGLVEDAAAYLRRAGYHIGGLFTEIPCRFYRRLGWASLPRSFFRVKIARLVAAEQHNWQVQPFVEARDLAAVVKLYEQYNARQSGSLVRPRAYWDMAPSRIRDVLPTVVARREDVCGGYLNYKISGQQAQVLEVAVQPGQPTALAALVDQFLQVCVHAEVREITGELPHRHPLVEQLIKRTDGDLSLEGDTAMMLYAVDLAGLLQQVLPELQGRLSEAAGAWQPMAFQFSVNQQQCVLQLSAAGQLSLVAAAAAAWPLDLPESYLWRLLFGQSSWQQLSASLATSGLAVPAEAAAVLEVLFPQREVIFWGPDHF